MKTAKINKSIAAVLGVGLVLLGLVYWFYTRPQLNTLHDETAATVQANQADKQAQDQLNRFHQLPDGGQGQLQAAQSLDAALPLSIDATQTARLVAGLASKDSVQLQNFANTASAPGPSSTLYVSYTLQAKGSYANLQAFVSDLESQPTLFTLVKPDIKNVNANNQVFYSLTATAVQWSSKTPPVSK